jgi:hypothetical protein
MSTKQTSPAVTSAPRTPQQQRAAAAAPRHPAGQGQPESRRLRRPCARVVLTLFRLWKHC